MNVRANRMAWGCVTAVAALIVGVGVPSPQISQGTSATLEGKFQRLDEPSTHRRGRVQVTEFADFYCPHCHMFEQTAIPMLKQEFGDKVEVTMVGFPVIPGMLPTAFLMYEQAQLMGKGTEMKNVLFRTIHGDRVKILDRMIRGALVRRVGLDPVAFEAGLVSGKPARAFEEGKKWGLRVKVRSTPTVVLDGNIKVEGEGMTA